MQDEFLRKNGRRLLYEIPHHEILRRRAVFHLALTVVDRDAGTAQTQLDLQPIMRLSDLRVILITGSGNLCGLTATATTFELNRLLCCLFPCHVAAFDLLGAVQLLESALGYGLPTTTGFTARRLILLALGQKLINLLAVTRRSKAIH